MLLSASCAAPAPATAWHMPLRFTSMCVWVWVCLLVCDRATPCLSPACGPHLITTQWVRTNSPNRWCPHNSPHRNTYKRSYTEHLITNVEAHASTAAQITWHKMFFNWLSIDIELFLYCFVFFSHSSVIRNDRKTRKYLIGNAGSSWEYPKRWHISIICSELKKREGA